MILNKDVYTIDPALVTSLREIPEPKTITDMRSFRGLAIQLAPYDPTLAQKLEPLRHLLKKSDHAFHMTEEERQAFTDVKQRLSQTLPANQATASS